jgi:hypothetical protein
MYVHVCLFLAGVVLDFLAGVVLDFLAGVVLDFLAGESRWIFGMTQ